MINNLFATTVEVISDALFPHTIEILDCAHDGAETERTFLFFQQCLLNAADGQRSVGNRQLEGMNQCDFLGRLSQVPKRFRKHMQVEGNIYIVGIDASIVHESKIG